MSRIPVPATDRIQAASLPLLNAVRKDLGTVPNLMKMLATSPAALGGYLRLNAALAGGSLGAKTGERIALAVAEIVNEVAQTDVDFPAVDRALAA